MTLIINNQSVKGEADVFSSISPFNGKRIWSGKAASVQQVEKALLAAETALASWRILPFTDRLSLVERFGERVTKKREELAYVIGLETGKPLWEAKTEVAAMISKIALSHQAYQERSGEKSKTNDDKKVRLNHRGLGVMAVLGPFNFPAHLPNGHIIPALLAGNTIVFKPSEQTPYTAQMMMELWLEAGLPKGVINLVQGGKKVGEALTHSAKTAGILFTGSAITGHALHRQLAGKPEKMLALEMGGNNPLIVSSHYGNLDACVYTIIQSAFLSAGQRCTCARRLFIPKGEKGNALISALIQATKALRISEPFDEDPPFMGALISEQAARGMLDTQADLIAAGAAPLLLAKHLTHAFVTPAILDVTAITELPDEEYFAPLLQVIRYQNFEYAIEKANQTRFGLSAGLISVSDSEWEQFYSQSRAGIVNRNVPLTGASGELPFGGIGASGNLRPSAYYAADYCAYPIASIEAKLALLPHTLAHGICPKSLKIKKAASNGK